MKFVYSFSVMIKVGSGLPQLFNSFDQTAGIDGVVARLVEAVLKMTFLDRQTDLAGQYCWFLR